MQLTVFLLSCVPINSACGLSVVPPECKNIPGSRSWPSEAQWQILKTAVGGRLLQPDPPAAACHRSQKSYNPLRCAKIRLSFMDSTWHANHPTSNMWQNYNNYSCMPSGSKSCSTTGYPLYVIEAESVEDIQAGVNFAKNNNIRLNIKSTGHDFLGRSVQPFSLSIWTHKLKSTKWYKDSFSPKDCKIKIDGPAVTAGAGSQWGYLNKQAKRRKVALVSGGFDTVSVGGFLANGGHGGLSAKYGLGADMVLEIELVNAAGEFITANECQNTDYFWAMRGGGGSTYGVVTSYTIKALPTFWTAMWAGFAFGWEEISYLHKKWPVLANAGASGYMMGYLGVMNAVAFTVSLPNGTLSDLRVLLEPILKNLNGKGVKDQEAESTELLNRGSYTQFETWGDAQEYLTFREEAPPTAITNQLKKRAETGQQGMFPGMGNNKILVSWLWSEKDVQHSNLTNVLKEALSDSGTYYLNDATMGAGTHNPPFIRGGGNAVNPAFRSAVMRPAAELQWSGSNNQQLAKMKQDAAKMGVALRSINPSGGTYANEADPDTPNWRQAFWGSNYERLLQIKTKVDPEGVFYCRRCVGSEFYEDHDGMLCRK